jgi:hypothetical protein
MMKIRKQRNTSKTERPRKEGKIKGRKEGKKQRKTTRKIRSYI